MSAPTQISSAERLGGALGRLWKKWLRLDNKICNRLATFGLSKGLIKFVLWAIKLIMVGALFYFLFWIALILAIALAAVGILRHADLSQLSEELNKTEWRYGPSGYGLYSSQGYRIDPRDERDE